MNMRGLSTMAAFAAVCAACAAAAYGQAAPEMPKPVKEHEWLERFVGEWTSTSEMVVEPGQPPVTCNGVERVRRIGGFWVLSEHEATVMETRVEARLTLGYSPEKGKFVGTWIDSMTSHMWVYEGTLNDAGTTLTLLTEGPNIATPGATAKYREVIEFTSADEKVMTSSIQNEDGSWTPFVTVTYTRAR